MGREDVLVSVKDGCDLAFGPIDSLHGTHGAVEQAALVAIAPMDDRLARREQVAEWPPELLQFFPAQILVMKTPGEASDTARAIVAPPDQHDVAPGAQGIPGLKNPHCALHTATA